MNRLLYMALPVLLASCTFDPELGDEYFLCMRDGACPGGCSCLEGRVCVPDDPDMLPKDCAWCSAGSKVCYTEKKAVCARILSDHDHCGGCWQACQDGFACEYGACVEKCREGLTDCEGDCVDKRTDPYNCGDCGHSCGPDKVCARGKCEKVCPQDTAPCNGACVDTSTDPVNCGTCGNICQLPNATTDCHESACVIFECLDCYQDCDQQAHNGCETCTDTDPGNCGECGVTCDDPPQPFCEEDNLIIYLDTGDCVDSQCKYQSSARQCEFGCNNGACKGDPCLQVDCNLNQHCEDGICVCDDFYADCDTSNLNGCETYINTTENCGECGFDCGADSVCNNGTCECEFGFGNCNNNWGDGCEEDLLHNDTHCGTCGLACTFPNDTCCAGSCVDIRTDRGNCGRCNLYCSGMTECCGGTCTDISLDAENCGSCGNTCGPPTETCCWGHCVDVMTDAGNCGDCGVECATNIPCHLGTCGAQGIHCGAETCDFFEEQCCYGVGGMGCYPSGDCTERIVECDDDSDCGDVLYCCLLDNSQYVTRCGSNCMTTVCSSAAYCAQNDPNNLHCCTNDYDGQLVNVCQSEFCQ